MSSRMTAGGDSSRQNAAPNQSHKSPERPRGGKSRRALIESACTACQRRKSRCDGIRPACSRCQASHTECGYNAEEGESRWSALRRRNRTLERERDEARHFITQIQSRPELEAQELIQHLRSNSHTSDIGAFIHEAVSAMSDHVSRQQQEQQQGDGEVQITRQAQSLYYDQQGHHDNTTQHFRPQQVQQPAQANPLQQRPAQHNGQGIFVQSSYTSLSSGPQLPPLRSMVELSSGGPNPTPLPPPFPPLTQRNMSLASNMSSGSYTSLSSSDGYGGQSLSPREGPHSS